LPEFKLGTKFLNMADFSVKCRDLERIAAGDKWRIMRVAMPDKCFRDTGKGVS
jgi:hypothetical protein